MPEFVVKMLLSTVFVLLGGVFSGLSLGLMGLDQMNLKVLAQSGSPQDRSDARKVLSLLSHGRHFVLVCLLLSNVIVNETLPIFLDSITGGGGLLAVLISSTLIFFAGEVLPQSICSQHGLRIGAKCVDFIRILMYLESPVCWPTAKLLDWLLGHDHSHLYRRNELRTLIELHSVRPDSEEGLNQVEVDVVSAALRMRDTHVNECMKRVEEVYTVNDGTRICDVDLKEVLLKSQSYIPVRRANSTPFTENEKGVFVGLLTVEQLVAALSTPNETIRALPLLELVQVLPSTSLSECMTYLEEHDRSTVFLVSNSSIKGGDALGFATIDDISRFLIDGTRRSNPEEPRSPTLVPPSRLSVARGRGRSVSLGIGAFVRGIVERQRTHRASASELSFRLSDDDSDSPYHPLRTSNSHHHTNSINSMTRNVSHSRPISTRPPSTAGGFKFPSPVLEQEDNFAIGDEETDNESVPGGVPLSLVENRNGYRAVRKEDSEEI
ncbi:uncharacterized protein JCM6883_004934 [Sporobolomyces salmoneus]|uniref:uncharacterized protein n=1 Tax=Sporobolomyces salmoneus TaxID=183962 RepID=UPI00317F7728